MHWSNVCGDQDAPTAAALQEACAEVGETRPLNWQYCNLHTQKSSHRKFTRDSMAKSTSFTAVSIDGRFGCDGCSRSFATKAGLGTHRRYCSSKKATSASTSASSGGRALEPLLKLNDINAAEAKVYKRKIAHWLLLRKNRELRNGTRFFRDNKCHLGTNDVNLKVRLKKAASSIVGCIENDHSRCELFSFVCASGSDPYQYLLPHGRPIPSMPTSVKAFIQDSVDDLFCSAKLDRLLYRGRLQTTSKPSTGQYDRPPQRFLVKRVRREILIIVNIINASSAPQHYRHLFLPKFSFNLFRVRISFT